jgi:type IV pilus assembly protein PilP
VSSLFALWAVLGCGEPLDEGKGAAKAPPPVKKAKEEKAVASEGDTYFYNPAGKRDPFQGFLTRQQSSKDEIDDAAPPLQRWDVDRFSLTGVIWDIDVPRALLIDPEGLGHVVKLGTYVGRNWGKVTAISQDGIVVTEEYQTLDGELVVNPVAVRFAGPAGKK